MNKEMTLDAAERRIMLHGPDRVVISIGGDAVPSHIARKEHGLTPTVIFIRDDGWSLGAPKELETQAYEMWDDLWIGFMRYPSFKSIPIEQYGGSGYDETE